MAEFGVSDALKGAEEALPEGRLAVQLESGEPLRVKFGIDPTAPDIHLGHCVPLIKLAQFQQAGHTAVLIVGDYTARVGDPSGRSVERPLLSAEQIDANAATFQDQAFKVLDRDRTEVRFNSEWLEMPVQDLLGLLAGVTVAQLLERDDFAKRMAAGQPVSALELLYPVMQGFDSVAVSADLELGGTDQKFNLLFARDIQAGHGQAPQSVLTMPILPGLDGVQRMSKSLGNYIGVTDAPEEMFGKLMSIPDQLMPAYYRLLLLEDPPAAAAVEAKRELARRIVARFHQPEAAEAAEAAFDRLHVRHELPKDVPEFVVEDAQVHMPALIAAAFDVSSSEARRLLQQGGVKLDGHPLAGEPLDRPCGELIGRVMQVGKRRFVRLTG
ncbi:MAG: tyrosine--tRNA ligase [Acidobacteria bacterium]|nr:tyrosine--tRNA ligase [Acidobacteriota bacterium]